ncbi:unnamed protein product [Rhizophagus irregularis]|uniref:HTH myb-type domain-containing protein n=1 Tax=Rhizophagus irregularis TaxID=588596 RepID=A0A2N1MQP3_9GLOM|nr:hypothetical protein RhiirC2_121366 [Rhizophagus irregularis]CAB4385702.1 unnamed protein product [Rhizophagus irregularis]CAB5363929.1 unnamed protein product [Rhizophagus irregularis]
MDPKVTELSSKDQNDLSVNSVGKTEEPNNDKSLTDDLSRKTTRQETKESRSSSSSISQLPEQQTVDYMQTSSEESSTEQPEDGSRKRGKKRVTNNPNPGRGNEFKRISKRVKVKWNERELHALEEGIRQYGKSWTNIKKKYGSEGQVLERRTQTQLKDKARSEFVRRLRDGVELGDFEIMDSI